MASILTVASGKGGVGKSVAVCNLGLALAARGQRVVLMDADLSGGNLATLFGIFDQGPTIDDFMLGQVRDLTDVVRPIRQNLGLVASAGESLAATNPNWGMKQRLIRHLRRLDADVVLVDVGAGAGHHALDFYRCGDLRILVTVPEPTASVDAYRFLKLAATRESLSSVSARDPQRRSLERTSAGQLSEVLEALPAEASDRQPFNAPWILLNQATDSRQSFERLRRTSRKFLGVGLELLGEVPRDEAIRESVSKFLPVVEGAPRSPAAGAFAELAMRLVTLMEPDSAEAKRSREELPERDEFLKAALSPRPASAPGVEVSSPVS